MGGKAHHRRKKKTEEVVAASADSRTFSAPASENVEIDYVVEIPTDIDSTFSDAFDRLAKLDHTDHQTVNKSEVAGNILDSLFPVLSSSTSQDESQTNLASSKKDQKKKHRPSLASLKEISTRPALVEVHDVTSPDPELLVFLKSLKMAVPVPRHWSSAVKYLAGKRNLDKKPYQLPDYIAQTGIGKLREATDDTNDSLQKRMRDRARPKLGKLSIDYHVLRDAFFKYQTKPRVTRHGELYFEGKEMEKDHSNFIPGQLSEELRQALGMPPSNVVTAPPPWLGNMQRFGPPPSYIGYSFPGVNAPLPAGAQYGLTGWGKPPVDHFGRGVFGDVMGVSASAQTKEEAAPVLLWGGFQHEEEAEEDVSRMKRMRQAEEEEEEEEGVVQAAAEDEAPIEMIESLPARPVSMAAAAPMAPPVTLIPEQVVDLRKSAHRVLEKHSATSTGGEVFGASHRYENVVSIAPEEIGDASLVARRAEEVLQPFLAPGAGTVDITQDLKKKLARDEKAKSANKAGKDKFKF